MVDLDDGGDAGRGLKELEAPLATGRLQLGLSLLPSIHGPESADHLDVAAGHLAEKGALLWLRVSAPALGI